MALNMGNSVADDNGDDGFKQTHWCSDVQCRKLKLIFREVHRQVCGLSKFSRKVNQLTLRGKFTLDATVYFNHGLALETRHDRRRTTHCLCACVFPLILPCWNNLQPYLNPGCLVMQTTKKADKVAHRTNNSVNKGNVKYGKGRFR